MANVRGLDDLKDKGDSDDERKHNDYYAGGEKSGQLLRGAPEDSSDDEERDRVASLFHRAKQAGARQGTSDDLGQATANFKGTGRTLAGGAGPSQASGSAGPTTRVITFYQNGIFTVDNGPPRRIDDPANLTFLTSISQGECPAELEVGGGGTPVTVNLVRKNEDYTEPEKPKYTAFQGSGRTLGAAAATAASTSAADSSSAADGEWAGVDESKPTTSLQLRLADGSRNVARFNTTHRVSDIRRFIRASRPDMQGPYQLLSGLPPKVIEDEAATLEAAGLLNAVIIQRK